MVPLRSPLADLDGFQLPGGDAPREAWEIAFKALRRIDLSWPQISAGYGESIATDRRIPDIVRLRGWCRDQGLHPADITAEAILVRMAPVIATRTLLPTFDTDAQRSMALRDLRVEQDVLQFAGSGPWIDTEGI